MDDFAESGGEMCHARGGSFSHPFPLSRSRVDGLGYRRGKRDTPQNAFAEVLASKIDESEVFDKLPAAQTSVTCVGLRTPVSQARRARVRIPASCHNLPWSQGRSRFIVGFIFLISWPERTLRSGPPRGSACRLFQTRLPAALPARAVVLAYPQDLFRLPLRYF